MLYSPSQFARDQLLADLIAVRARLEKQWAKGAWQEGDNACLVGTVQIVVGVGVGDTYLPAGTTVEPQVRLGRALAAVYMALRGPHAPASTTMSDVVADIICFNDRKATHSSVLLLLDRAIAAVHEQAGATVTASG